MRATRQFTFEAAHRLPDHDGKCRRLHGHHYVVEVTVEGDTKKRGPQTGMVLDFSRIDAALLDTFDAWDHRTLLWIGDPLWVLLMDTQADSIIGFDEVPTAEYLASFIGEYATTQVEGVNVVEVIVRETPKGWATWTP